jgi:hypothetical protein
MSEKPKVKLFREKSLEAVESPESLNDYLRVTSPGVWLIMSAVIALLVGGILWSIFGHIRTTADFAVAVTKEKSVCYVTYDAIDKVLARGVINIEGADYPLKMNADYERGYITDDTSPRILLAGNLKTGDRGDIAPVITALAEGDYTGEVV